jgi:hypothetical protein
LEAAAAVPAAAVRPPIAPQRPHEIRTAHGSRIDPYFWLRDDTRKDPEVLGYLQRENDYAASVMAPLGALEGALFAEMRGRLKEDDSTVPTLDDGYWYYTRFEAGKQQPIHARRRGTLEAPEEVLLDGNQLASGHAYYRVAGYEVSRDGKLLAYADDVVGRNQFRLHIKDLVTGELLPDSAENIASSLVWANDNRTLFFVGKDATTLREDRVFRHVLGQKHELVFKEDDGSYYVSLQRTKSRRYGHQLDHQLGGAADRRRSPDGGSSRLPPAFQGSSLPARSRGRRLHHAHQSRGEELSAGPAARRRTGRARKVARRHPASRRRVGRRLCRLSRLRRGFGAHGGSLEGRGHPERRDALLSRCS